MRLAITALALVVAGAGGQSPVLSDLPSEIAGVLSAAFPDWRFARLDPSRAMELTAEPGRRRSPEWVSGDFDGDGRLDYAVQIVRRNPPEHAQAIVVLLARSKGYTTEVVQAMSEQDRVYLSVSRRGDRVRDLERDENGRVTVVLSRDAIDIVWVESAALTCVYEAARWRCIVSAD